MAIARARAAEATTTGRRHAGRRRGGARHQGPALRPRRALRRHLRLHQEHPRLRPRRRPVLAGPDARGGGGRPLHRPAPRDPGQRGRRRGRPDGPGGGRGGRPRRRARRAARGAAQPGPGRRAPGHRPEVEPVRRWASGTPGRTCSTARRSRCPPTSATPTTTGRRSSGTARATTILTTTPRAGCRSSTSPTRSRDRRYYDPSDHGFEQEIRTRMERRTRGHE